MFKNQDVKLLRDVTNTSRNSANMQWHSDADKILHDDEISYFRRLSQRSSQKQIINVDEKMKNMNQSMGDYFGSRSPAVSDIFESKDFDKKDDKLIMGKKLCLSEISIATEVLTALTMPEINSKRNHKKQTSSPKKKKKNNAKNKSNSITSAGRKWGSTATEVEEKRVSSQQLYMGLGLIFIVFMFILWAFVDDRPEWQKQQQYEEEQRRKNESLAKRKQRQDRNAALASYNYADLLNSTTLSAFLQNMQNPEDDRLLVVTFADSTADESAGNVYKIRLFKKMDGIAKRISKHRLFKRYEEEDMPHFGLFDCGSPNDPASENVCKQVVGTGIPNILVFRPRTQPRPIPNDIKSDNQIISYLYDLMQPAVKYLDELVEAEDFVADDSELHCMLFSKSSDKEAINVYERVSDGLRDFGRYGRTQNHKIVESFDLDEAQLPSLLIWRTFGENPQIFSGNITSGEAVRDFVMNNYLPIFGEFTPKSSKRVLKRGLPILWVAHNDGMTDDALQLLLNSALSIAKRYRGQLTFVELDVDAQPQIASNFGLDPRKDKSKNEEDDDEDEEEEEDEESEDKKLPQVFMMNQVAQIKKPVNMDDIEGTVQSVIDEYLMQLRIQRGDAMQGLQGDEDDDDEFEEDDDDDDDEEDDEDSEETKESKKKEL